MAQPTAQTQDLRSKYFAFEKHMISEQQNGGTIPLEFTRFVVKRGQEYSGTARFVVQRGQEYSGTAKRRAFVQTQRH
jgi:hypothetical protein